MRRSTWTLAAIGAALAIGSTGCGGGGGSSSGGGGNSGGTGGSLSASMTLLSGALASTAAAGSTSNVQLADGYGKLHTINSVYSPDSLNNHNYQDGYWTVIRAGSSLLSGHYTSTTAKFINANENFSSTIPLNADGTFAKDTIIPDLDGAIVLPIDKIGNYTTPNGVSVTFNSGANDYAVQNNTLGFAATIPPLGKSNPDAGQLTFTDTGTVSPLANMTLAFASADGQSGFQLAPTTSTVTQSPWPLAGYAAGSSSVMTQASVLYVLVE